MTKHRFGKTQLQVSPLGFGAAPIGFLETEQRRVDEILNSLLDSGVNVIDTAACYAGSEGLIGNAVGHRRDEYVVVSKCGHQIPESDAPEWSAELIGVTVERALRRLRTDHLDVMLLHSCSRDVLERGEALAALREAQQGGKVRYVGYSGDNETAAYAAGLDEVAVIETSVNIADQRNIDVVLPATRNGDVGVVAKRPIADAAWKDRNEQRGPYQSYAETYSERLRQMGLAPGVLGIEGSPELAWPELALRFTVSQPGVHVAIVGTTNPDHVRGNIAAAEKGPLPEKILDAVRGSFHRADPDGSWMGQT